MAIGSPKAIAFSPTQFSAAFITSTVLSESPHELSNGRREFLRRTADPYLYYSLYVILDLFSRYVVGWMVAAHENARLAQRLIAATCRKQGVGPRHLTIHADRGAPMRSKLVAELFSDLSIDASHSRPRVSNDNPFSEAQFRTFKYRPEFPARFGSLEHGRCVTRDLFAWYNDAHHHSGLSYLTPADVHYGRAATMLEVPSSHAPGRVRRASRALRAGPTAPRKAAARGVDQSAGEIDRPGCPRSDDGHPGRPAAAWGNTRLTRHARTSIDRAHAHRGVATVNCSTWLSQNR